MISVKCEKCMDNWFVSDDIWKKVKYCPFCGEKIKVSYDIKEDSFEGLLKNIVFNQGLGI